MRRHVDDFGLLLVIVVLAVTLVFLVLPIVVSVMMSFDGGEYLGRFPPPEQAGKSIDLVFRPEDCIIVPADS